MSAEGNDVVHSGFLLLKVKGKIHSSYHQGICALHRETLDGTKRLEIKELNSGKVTTIPINDLLEVRESTSKKEKSSNFPFEVICAKGKHTLAAETKEERQNWIALINKIFSGEPEPGITYKYSVTMQANESSKKFGMSGNYVLQISEINMSLYSATGLIPTPFNLDLCDIRRLQQCSLMGKQGGREDIIVIYTMPHSGVGEGTYVLKSPNSSEISQIIDRRIKILLQRDGSSDEVSIVSRESTPPPLPSSSGSKKRGKRQHSMENNVMKYHERPSIKLKNGIQDRSRSFTSTRSGSINSEIVKALSPQEKAPKKTLANIGHSYSEDSPMSPRSKTFTSQNSFTSTTSDAFNDEPILVDTKEIMSQVRALKKNGFVQRNASINEQEEFAPTLPPRRLPFRNDRSYSPPISNFSSSPSPGTPSSRFPSYGTSGRHQSLSSRSSNNSEGSPRKHKGSVSSNCSYHLTNGSSLNNSFGGTPNGMPLDVLQRSEQRRVSEQMTLAKWAPHHRKESKPLPELPDRDARYISNSDIQPGPERTHRPIVNFPPHLSDSTSTPGGSTRSSSCDESGYLILKADDKDLASWLEHKAIQKDSSPAVKEGKRQVHRNTSADVILQKKDTSDIALQDIEDGYEPPPGHTHLKKKKAKSFSEDTNMLPEFYDNVEELTSAQHLPNGHNHSDLESTSRETSSSPYSNLPLGAMATGGPTQRSPALSSSDDEDVSNWTNITSLSEAEVNLPGMHVRRKISTSSVTGRRVSIHKSSSITGLNNLITPIVSEAHYTRDGSDSENDERENPIEIAQLTRRLIRQDTSTSNFRSMENIHEAAMNAT